MNIYCWFCGKEMEILQDLGTVIKVVPCGCKGEETEEETDKEYLRNEMETNKE